MIKLSELKIENARLTRDKDLIEVQIPYLNEKLLLREKSINMLKSKIFIIDLETGEMKDKTIIDSYKTPNYYYWRNTNLQEQIAYECNADDSMFDLGYYIKFLEKKSYGKKSY